MQQSDKFNPYPLTVGLLRSSEVCYICFNESPLKMKENAFYFNLKALFVLEMFKFLL